MKSLVFAGVLTGGVLSLIGATNRLGNDLTVHEWGTFTSVAGSDGTPVEWNTLGCADDLPHFVNKGPVFKVALSGTVRMETPILYFYTSHDVDANVRVRFPGGRITEWYPKADVAGDAMEWKTVQVRPGGASKLLTESSPSRYYAARATDSAPLMADGQAEKFLFYRGVATIPVPLSARVSSDGRIAIAKTVTDAVPAVFLFENRGGAIGYRNVGRISDSAVLDPPALSGTASDIKADLRRALMDQGLYPKEAAAMIDTWRDSWFEEGSRLIYILPASAVNAMLPLQIEPAPAKIDRVFVGRIELITPETKRAVKEALAKGDARTLAAYQRFFEPIGKSIGQRIDLPCQNR